jgi:MFS family permease
MSSTSGTIAVADRTTTPQSPVSAASPAAAGWFARVRGFQRDAKLYLLAAAMLAYGNGALWVHMNLWYRAVGLQEEAIGRLLALGSAGAMLVSIPAAVWVDRVPPGRAFAWTAAGFAVAFGAQLLWPLPAVLAVGSFAAGACFAVHWVAAAPFFMRTAKADDRADLFGIAHAVETASTLVAAWLIGAIAAWVTRDLHDERTGLQIGLATALLFAVAAVPLYLGIRTPAAPHGAKTVRDHLRPKDWRVLAKLVVPAALIGLGAGLVVPFLNLYLRDRWGLDPNAIGLSFAVAQMAMAGGFLLGPWMARRFGSVAAVVTTELASVPFFVLMAFAPSLPWALVAFWMRGVLMNMNQPISSAFALEQVPADQHAVTNSLRMLSWNLAWAVSTQIGGAWIERWGFTPGMLAAVGLYVAGSGSFWWFCGRRK